MHKPNASQLAMTAIILTLIYFLIWLIGPLFFAHSGEWAGLPIWFWISCILAPLLLTLFSFLCLSGDQGEH